MLRSSGGLIRPSTTTMCLLQRLADIFVILSTFWASNYLYGANFQQYQWLAVSWVLVLFLIFSEVKGLYHSWRVSSLSGEILTILGLWLSVIGSLIVIAFLTKLSDELSRVVVLLWIVTAPTVLVLVRISVRSWLRLVRREGRNSRALAFAGVGDMSRKLNEMVGANPWMGINIVGVYDDNKPELSLSTGLEYKGKFRGIVANRRAPRVNWIWPILPSRKNKRR